MWRNLPLLLVALAMAVVVAAYFYLSSFRLPDVPYVTTPPQVIDAMLELADLRPDDVVYDLGCGDGRLVVAAAREHGVKGVGIEIDPVVAEQARARVQEEGVEHLVTIRRSDIFHADLRPASVLLLYLHPTVNERLIPQIARMKPGSRIVSHQFSIPGMKPRRTVVVKGEPGKPEARVLLYVTPLEQESTPAREDRAGKKMATKSTKSHEKEEKRTEEK